MLQSIVTVAGKALEGRAPIPYRMGSRYENARTLTGDVESNVEGVVNLALKY